LAAGRIQESQRDHAMLCVTTGTDLTKWLTVQLTIDPLQEALTVG